MKNYLRWRNLNTLLSCALPVFLGGCAVIAVVDVVATVAVGTAGLAADAAIGTAKIAGRAVGAAADVILPSNAGR